MASKRAGSGWVVLYRHRPARATRRAWNEPIVPQPGENRFPVDLAAGRGSFALTIEEPTSDPVPDNGDTRLLILHLTDYSIERGGKGQP
jgi:hypothetical protein